MKAYDEYQWADKFRSPLGICQIHVDNGRYEADYADYESIVNDIVTGIKEFISVRGADGCLFCIRVECIESVVQIPRSVLLAQYEALEKDALIDGA